eukprot:TRINITY_DN2561_c0_g2_i1.p1 TRINITY_DN2561_c0_g2~~TRINITY_DN2561_c0_g2_i1.p1  ORF type:complete len:180 (+),score=24.16 TRINITY_DN2561_c0_g2_i1:66-605(+)
MATSGSRKFVDLSADGSRDLAPVMPSGYSERVSSDSEDRTRQKKTDLKIKKAWDLAKGAAKGVPMLIFMFWMVGNTVNIFSIPFLVYQFWNPVRALLGLSVAFSKYEADGFEPHHHQQQQLHRAQLLLPKLAYAGVQLAIVALCVYKCAAMGLLPTTADFVAHYVVPKLPAEFSTHFAV